MHRIAEAALGLAVLLLLALLAVPWNEPALPSTAAADSSPSRLAPVSAAASASPASPEAILPIFIGRPAPKAAAPPPAAKLPQDAPWLLYLGRSRSSDGVTYVFVKDTKTGKLIKAAQDGGADGWSIMQELADRLILKNGDLLYSVVKR